MTLNDLRFYRQHCRKKGYPPSESHCLAVRTVLLAHVKEELVKHNWTQKEAAERLGVKQPRISEIYAGSIDKFSAELLVKYLFKLGKEVTFSVDNIER